MGDESETPVDLAQVHPYYRAILQRYAESGRPFFHQVTPAVARDMLRASVTAAPPQQLPPMASIVDEFIATSDTPVPVRRYRPEGPVRGMCLYFHAGGWIMGDLDFSNAICRRLAAGAGCEIVSVDYRLAPEHPFPAALDDARTVLEWAHAHHTGALLLAGESAGGNIAAACAIHARDNGGPAIAGQVLAYPVLDHAMNTSSYRDVGSQNWLLSTADMAFYWDQYCPAGVNRRDPLVSPLRVADAAGLPPAFIATAELDPLRDEGQSYAARLAASGVAVRTRCDAGMLHGYLGAAGAVAAATEAVAEAASWMHTIIERGA